MKLFTTNRKRIDPEFYTVKTELREVFEKCFNFKQKCFVATEISHVVFHNSDTKCLDHPNSYLQLFVQ